MVDENEDEEEEIIKMAIKLSKAQFEMEKLHMHHDDDREE
jgi:hypothetical protein